MFVSSPFVCGDDRHEALTNPLCVCLSYLLPYCLKPIRQKMLCKTGAAALNLSFSTDFPTIWQHVQVTVRLIMSNRCWDMKQQRTSCLAYMPHASLCIGLFGTTILLRVCHAYIIQKAYDNYTFVCLSVGLRSGPALWFQGVPPSKLMLWAL